MDIPDENNFLKDITAEERKALKKYTKDATCLIVAQRIGTIMNADKIIVLDDKNFCVKEVASMEPPHINIIVVYPVEFIGDPVLEENIPKMLSVVREYIKEYESYLTFKTKIGNTVWDSEKLKYGNIAYEHQERADKLAEKMNEGISPYFWYVGKVSENVVFNEISRKVDYAVCLEKMI